jgi:hypothetical protein
MVEEVGPKISRMDFELAYASTVKGRENYKTNISYIAKYQIIYIRIKNNSNGVLNVNPNSFTLVSNMKISYHYSSETHTFKDKIRFIDESPLQAVNVYPGTTTEGFLLFDKKHEDERPQKLFFQNIKEHLSIDVILDKKVREQ